VLAEIPIGTACVPGPTESLREIEYQRDRQAVVLPRERHQRFPCFGLHVRRVDDREFSRPEAFRRNEVEHFEHVVRRGLVVFVVRHEGSAEIRGNDLRWLEEVSRESRLPRPGRAHKYDQGVTSAI
jgi:hypothetical protein